MWEDEINEFRKHDGVTSEHTQVICEAPVCIECLWDENHLSKEMEKYHIKRVEVLKGRVKKSLIELKEKYNISLSI